MLRKRLVSLLAVAAIGLIGLAGSASGQAAPSHNQGTAHASKSCGYGTPARTPGGIKCLGPGEYCSHKPGYAAAYRKAGFRCNRSGRLEYDSVAPKTRERCPSPKKSPPGSERACFQQCRRQAPEKSAPPPSHHKFYTTHEA